METMRIHQGRLVDFRAGSIGGEMKLPELQDVCSDEDVVLRAARWTERTFAIIDEDMDFIDDGESQGHAGIEAEWELIQRERQLLASFEREERSRAMVQEFVDCYYGKSNFGFDQLAAQAEVLLAKVGTNSNTQSQREKVLEEAVVIACRSGKFGNPATAAKKIIDSGMAHAAIQGEDKQNV
jgi:hypothetical protein